MDDDEVIRSIVVERALDHALELRPILFGPRDASVDVVVGQLPRPCCAMSGDRVTLLRQRQFALRLPRRRHAAVATSFQVLPIGRGAGSVSGRSHVVHVVAHAENPSPFSEDTNRYDEDPARQIKLDCEPMRAAASASAYPRFFCLPVATTGRAVSMQASDVVWLAARRDRGGRILRDGFEIAREARGAVAENRDVQSFRSRRFRFGAAQSL